MVDGAVVASVVDVAGIVVLACQGFVKNTLVPHFGVVVVGGGGVVVLDVVVGVVVCIVDVVVRAVVVVFSQGFVKKTVCGAVSDIDDDSNGMVVGAVVDVAGIVVLACQEFVKNTLVPHFGIIVVGGGGVVVLDVVVGVVVCIVDVVVRAVVVVFSQGFVKKTVCGTVSDIDGDSNGMVVGAVVDVAGIVVLACQGFVKYTLVVPHFGIAVVVGGCVVVLDVVVGVVVCVVDVVVAFSQGFVKKTVCPTVSVTDDDGACFVVGSGSSACRFTCRFFLSQDSFAYFVDSTSF